MERWRNKVAVVTGASAGIGAACCKYLVENGMIVVGLARRKERIEAFAASDVEPESRTRLHALKCDVRNENEVCNVFAEIENKYGPIAVLINNAGIARLTELVRDNNSEDLRSIVETNILGVAYCTREAFRSMKKHGGEGHVVLINSIAGHKVLNMPGRSPNMYTATKHGITAMTEVYRQEFLMYNTKVKITSISPGLVDTEIYGEQMQQLRENMPQLHANDVADAVIYCIQTPPNVQIHELTIKPVGELY